MNQIPNIGFFLKRTLLVLVILATLPSTIQAQCPEIVASSTPPLCSGDLVTLTLQNHTGVLLGWSTSTSPDFSLGSITDILNDNSTITFEEGFSETTYVRANLVLAGCPNPIITIEIQQPVENNIISSPLSSISCDTPLPIIISGDSGLSPDSGNNFIWQTKVGPTSWITISASGTENLTINQIANQNIYLRRIVEPQACANDTSNVIFIEASEFSDGGVITGEDNICYGDEGAELILTEYVGEILTWEESNDGINFTEIASTEGLQILPVNTLEAGQTHYRALVQNGSCTAEYSTTKIVTVHEEITNSILTSDQIYCGPTIPEPIEGSVISGGEGSFSVLWQRKAESNANWSIVPNQPVFIDFEEPLQETTLYRRIVSGSFCSSISDTATVTIIPITQAGNFTDSDAAQQICLGTEADSIILTNFVGDIQDWYSAPTAEGPWEALNHTDSILVPGNPIANIFYKVQVKSGICNTAESAIYQVIISPDISNNIILADQILCPGEIAQTITGTFPEGGAGTYTLQWQTRQDEGLWTAALGENIGLNYTPSDNPESAQFRRVVSSENCSSDTSNTVFINRPSAPSATWSSDGIFCPGVPMIITAQLEGTPPFIITFNDGNETYTIDGINTNSYSITVYDTIVTTYTLTAVSDAYCSSDEDMPPSAVVITPIEAVEPPSAGLDLAICGLSVDLSGTEPQENQIGYWSNLAGDLLADTANFTFTGIDPGVYEFVYTVENPMCSQSASDTVTITLDIIEPAVVGDDLEVCAQSTTLNANPVDWCVGHWLTDGSLSINDPFDPQATVSGMSYGNSYSLLWITESILGVCEPDTAELNITVSNESISGVLSASSDIICQGEEVTANLSGQVGTVSQWLLESDSGNNESIADSATTVTFNNLNTSHQIYVVVQSGVCPPDTTASLSITVNPQTEAGLLSSDQTVCSGINSGTIELTDFTGEILFWEVTSDGFGSVDTVQQTSATYTFENLISTHQYRAVVKSGVCQSESSNTVTISTVPAAEVVIDLPEFVCTGDDPIDLDTMIDGNTTGVWTINGEEADILDPQQYSEEDIQLTYTVPDAQCSQPFFGSIAIMFTPEITLSGSFEVCGPIVEINAETSVGSGMWTLDETLLCNQPLSDETIELTALEYGVHQVTYTAQNGVCTQAATTPLVFDAQPDSAYAGEDQILKYTESTALNAVEPNVGAGTWSAEDPSLTFANKYAHNTGVRNLKTGINLLTWSVENGVCPKNTATLRIEVLDLSTPNAFSPNGDNVNDTYVIHGLHEFGAVSLTVWNRWGNTVFESSNYQNDWDGTNKNGNELGTDTYYYLLEGESLPKSFKGFIVIQR